MVILRTAVLIVVLAMLCSAGADAAPIAGPFGMAGKSVGGANTIGAATLMDFVCRRDPVTQELYYVWELVGGASNVGLTAKIWGTVTAVYHLPTGEQWFCVDDGSAVDSDLGDMGVLVYSDAAVVQGQFVSVVGAVDTEESLDSTARLVRTVEPGSAADVTVLREAPVPYQYPFSDEFDGPELDLRWAISCRVGQLSLTSAPGYLVLTPAPQPSSSFCVVQLAYGDWDVECKVRVVCDPSVDGSAFAGLVDTNSYVYEADDLFAGLALSCTGGTASLAVYLNGQNAGTLPGDTCWLRYRRRGHVISACYSTDGIAFSPEATTTKDMIFGSLLLYAEKNTATLPFAAHFDYIRFTAPE